MVGKVARLFVHPIKSLRGQAVQELSIDGEGPVGDREFVVTDSAGRFLSQRQIPGMVKVIPTREPDRLLLSGTTGAASIPLPALSEEGDVSVWSQQIRARLVGAAADEFLSGEWGRPVRLWMYQSARPRVGTSPQGAEFQFRFSDQAQVLLTSESSLQALANFTGRSLAVERFRPNLHVDGFSAWTEETWRRVRVGAVEFEVMKRCTRCKIITIHPESAAVDAPEILEALRNGVKGGQAKPDFGMLLRVLHGGVVRTGDPVEGFA